MNADSAQFVPNILTDLTITLDILVPWGDWRTLPPSGWSHIHAPFNQKNDVDDDDMGEVTIMSCAGMVASLDEDIKQEYARKVFDESCKAVDQILDMRFALLREHLHAWPPFGIESDESVEHTMLELLYDDTLKIIYAQPTFAKELGPYEDIIRGLTKSGILQRTGELRSSIFHGR